ncbi:MAG: hypothetical protein QXP66_04430, partial [Candidatus Aenigmatarchaeota archaeon]
TWFGDGELHKHWNDDELGRFSFTKKIPGDLNQDEQVYSRSYIYGEFECIKNFRCKYGNEWFNNHNRSDKSNRVLPKIDSRGGIKMAINYLCEDNNVSNFSVNGVSKDAVCKSIKDFVTLKRISYKDNDGAFGVYCPAQPNGYCVDKDGNITTSGRSIEIDTSFLSYPSQYTANILIHEGQHAHWNENNKPNNQTLENEFISHKMEGLLIQEKGLHTTTISRNDPAGRMFLDKTVQLFNRTGNTYELKDDDRIYFEVCDRYKLNLILVSETIKCNNLKINY